MTGCCTCVHVAPAFTKVLSVNNIEEGKGIEKAKAVLH